MSREPSLPKLQPTPRAQTSHTTPPHPFAPRSSRALRALCILLILCISPIGVACTDVVGLEEPPPDVISLPPGERELQILDHFPQEGTEAPRDTGVWVAFDQYLQGRKLLFYNTLQVRSGGLSASVRSHYEMVDHRVVARLPSGLEPGLAYTLSVNLDNLFAVTGARLLTAPEFHFTATEERLNPSEVAYIPGWKQDIEPIIIASCSCHQTQLFPATWFDIPPLTYESIYKRASVQAPETLIVSPRKPWESYLMFKLLSDYPLRGGGLMPPLWTEDFEHPDAPKIAYLPPSPDQLRLIERWIRLGAPEEREALPDEEE